MTVIICDGDTDTVDGGVDSTALAALCAEKGWNVVLTPHLCALSDTDPFWTLAADFSRPVAVFMPLYPRATCALLNFHGVFCENLQAFDSRRYASADEALADVVLMFGDIPAGGAPGNGEITTVAGDESLRWYPVIDTDRCRHCGACFQFCLFGVYAQDEAGNISVTAPDECKDGCPACSRICPEKAIIFPRCTEDPVIAGGTQEKATDTVNESIPAGGADSAIDAELDDLLNELDTMQDNSGKERA